MLGGVGFENKTATDCYFEGLFISRPFDEQHSLPSTQLQHCKLWYLIGFVIVSRREIGCAAQITGLTGLIISKLNMPILLRRRPQAKTTNKWLYVRKLERHSVRQNEQQSKTG